MDCLLFTALCCIEYPEANLRSGDSAQKTTTVHRLMVQDACTFMQANFERPLSVSDIAQAVFTSTFHFSRVFTNHMKVTPARFLIELRIKHAAKLLCTANTPVKNISFSVGFANPAYFSLLFKKETGLSPKAYRKIHAAAQKT